MAKPHLTPSQMPCQALAAQGGRSSDMQALSLSPPVSLLMRRLGLQLLVSGSLIWHKQRMFSSCSSKLKLCRGRPVSWQEVPARTHPSSRSPHQQQQLQAGPEVLRARQRGKRGGLPGAVGGQAVECVQRRLVDVGQVVAQHSQHEAALDGGVQLAGHIV